MRAIAPRIEGCEEVTVAEDQLEFAVLTVALVEYQSGDRGIMTRWRLSMAEREQVIAGADIYVGQLTQGGPMMPMSVSVGEPWPTSQETKPDGR